MRSLRGVVQFLIYGIEREWDEYLSILFQSGSSLEGEVGSWNDLCFREIYSSIILLVYRESNRDENPFLICHQFAYILLYLIFCYCGDLHL